MLKRIDIQRQVYKLTHPIKLRQQNDVAYTASNSNRRLLQ